MNSHSPEGECQIFSISLVTSPGSEEHELALKVVVTRGDQTLEIRGIYDSQKNSVRLCEQQDAVPPAMLDLLIYMFGRNCGSATSVCGEISTTSVCGEIPTITNLVTAPPPLERQKNLF